MTLLCLRCPFLFGVVPNIMIRGNLNWAEEIRFQIKHSNFEALEMDLQLKNAGCHVKYRGTFLLTDKL